MRKIKQPLFILFFFVAALNGPAQDCPEKIKWNKLKTETGVKEVVLKCVPLNSKREILEAFLIKNKMVYSDINGKIVYASIRVRSKSIWIEKKWLFEFTFDANDELTELKVEVGLTGP